MTAGAPEPRRWKPSTDRPETLDLAKRWLDVRHMAKSHPMFKACLRAGWDGDDLVQEVLCRAVARQGMGSRYNPRKAGVGKYLHVLCGSILTNLSVSVRLLGHSNEVLLEETDRIEEVEDPNPWDLSALGNEDW